MSKMWDRPPPSHDETTEEASAPEMSDERRGWLSRLRAWFRRPAPQRDSYVSNVTNPDDRRFIPRR
jgi:hypothetical protein